ncbi:hypothetical protein UCMB321_2103 [Pseudomonas batumici]|uniref:Uncharacterized protein n=1 Tax=Pseudomonas batumici TaxID=226910 RepID=A0A0C2EZ32_9PSED|nr:hypothetical protein UCMB321_2103 [Pseudomonas batumici]
MLHINVQPEPVEGDREFSLAGRAAEVLPRLVEEVFAT